MYLLLDTDVLLNGRRDHDHMVIGYATTYTNSAYHHESCEFKSSSW
jgi:hypothetical protein